VSVDVGDLQTEVAAWMNDRWGEHGDPYGACVKMTEEVGEVARALIRDESPDRVAEELADVIITAIGVAVRVGADIAPALESKWVVVQNR